ncbi:MAG: formimidoylglutamate deiminase [Paracoccaceae bacterium]
MEKIFARNALLPSGWAKNVLIEFNEDGLITNVNLKPHETAQNTVGILLPSPVNVHSHSFQRAMAGLTESRGPNPTDSFWTWRKLMFRFLNQLTPEHIEKICAFVQMEMLEAGYATNVEFHYLHHQPGGTPYEQLAEMTNRIVTATLNSGIGLTILPVHYQYGGCDKSKLGEGQIRFGNTLEQFSLLLEEGRKTIKFLPKDSSSGLAAHSLRAVGKEDFPKLATLAGDSPIHMHLAEQVAEVEEVLEVWGKRPAEWVIENLPINSQWCLIHCTQMLPHEVKDLAATGAIAGLCPITESNLGDGIFDGLNWLKNGGSLAVGSDSNIRISLSEEIRTLEYSQRLRDKSRASLATEDKSTARRIFDEILTGGAKAANRKTGEIKIGKWADLISLDENHTNLIQAEGDTILDCFVFSSDDKMIKDVWSAGRHQVKNGHHINRENIICDYSKIIRELGELI